MGKEITLDVDKLQQIIAGTVAATVAEMRKPEPPSPQELAEVKQKQEERRATAEALKQQKQNARWFREHGCKHEHSGPMGGTHCVFVRDNDVPLSPGYIYCQKCEGRFRPDEPIMRKLDPDAIFDTAKFNELLPACLQAGAEIME